MSRLAGLLLAAGGGVRMGGPKALVEFDGAHLVDRGIGLLAEGGCDAIVVVVGAQADRVCATADLAGASVVRNPDWASGMGSSLRIGLAALPDDAGACVIALVDQPLIGAEAVRRLARAWRDGALAAVATYAGQPRNPVLLDRSLWRRAAESATGDQGARAFLRAEGERVVKVGCDDTGSPADLDTPADLASVQPH